MLRPSRPMMRPFMSSEGSATRDTVVSAAWPAARRCMHAERMLRERRVASRRASSSTWRTTRAFSWRACSSTSCSRSWRACARPIPARRSSSSRRRSRGLLQLARRAARPRARALPSARSRSETSARRCFERLLALQDPLLQAHDLRRALDGVGRRRERGLARADGRRRRCLRPRRRRAWRDAGDMRVVCGTRSAGGPAGLGVDPSAHGPGGGCRQAGRRGRCDHKLHGSLSVVSWQQRRTLARLRETERRGAACRPGRPTLPA